MIKSIIFCALTLPFSIALPMELAPVFHDGNDNVSDSQWELVLQAVHKVDSASSEEMVENKFETLFPEIAPLPDPAPLLPQTSKQLPEQKKRTQAYKECPKCGKLVSKISVHLRYHTDEYNYPCEYCPKKFKESCALNRHQLKDHEEQFNYQCDQCSKLFKELDALTKHQKTHQEEIPHTPALIPMARAMRDRLRPARIRVHAETKPLSLPHQGSKLDIEVKQSVPTHASKITAIHFRLKNNKLVSKAFVCRFCKKNFEYERHLKTHLNIHKIQKPPAKEVVTPSYESASPQSTALHTKIFECAFCKKNFEHENDLQIHLNVHTVQKASERKALVSRRGCKVDLEIKNYLPTQAPEFTAIRFQLIKKTLHAKAFICFCKKQFKYYHELQAHLNVHAIQKPYACPNCNKTFAETFNLEDHMLNCCQSLQK